MSVRGLGIAAVLLAVLLGLVYWSDKTQKAEEEAKSSNPANRVVNLKEDDVRKVEIARKDSAPLVMERPAADKSWEMKSPEPLRVDQESASALVSAFTGLSQDRVVEEKASDLSAYGLNSPSVAVTVTAGGKTERLLVGDETPTGGNFYAKLDNDPRVFTIYSGTKTSLDKTPKDLRDKRLLTFDSGKVSRVELSAKGQTIEFGKNASNEWQIVRPRPLRADNFAVEDLVGKLRDARMDTTASDEDLKKAASGFAGASRVATVSVTDASGAQSIEVRKKGDDYFAKSSIVNGIHKIGNDVGEALNKGVDDYRNKKLFDFGFNDPSKVEITDAGKTYSFTKSGEKWSAGGKTMDAVGVQSLIDKLRDLSATKFVESGFTTPSTEIIVTSSEGKRTEKVLISKSGDQYLARRENEPATYVLDAKAVEELLRAAADVKEPPPPTSAPAKK